jgi:hypothetical protein
MHKMPNSIRWIGLEQRDKNGRRQIYVEEFQL